MSDMIDLDPLSTAPVALPAQIDNAERDYLATLLAQAQAARTAMNSFSSYLAAKYHLEHGDSVTPDGQIVRTSYPT